LFVDFRGQCEVVILKEFHTVGVEEGLTTPVQSTWKPRNQTMADQNWALQWCQCASV